MPAGLPTVCGSGVAGGGYLMSRSTPVAFWSDGNRPGGRSVRSRAAGGGHLTGRSSPVAV
ncbi:hypothetical protein GCM10025868_14210 [Angustibacter aerolatus]|uniref:Uncharacterized protein n=1 Tax=Angustibacter aerolatus TaxID=1162965 RepID=A0ABQ6JDA0_9ACTN|nr:hypothetical protein GCM10025868_14210 [Angustibacter aerolatus]